MHTTGIIDLGAGCRHHGCLNWASGIPTTARDQIHLDLSPLKIKFLYGLRSGIPKKLKFLMVIGQWQIFHGKVDLWCHSGQSEVIIEVKEAFKAEILEIKFQQRIHALYAWGSWDPLGTDVSRMTAVTSKSNSCNANTPYRGSRKWIKTLSSIRIERDPILVSTDLCFVQFVVSAFAVTTCFSVLPSSLFGHVLVLLYPA